MKLIVTLPLPPKAMSPNGRRHWAAKARATNNYRGDAKLATLAVLRTVGQVCAWDAATVEPHFYHRENRRRDGDNATACLKAGFDGVADAGVVKNDADLKHLPPVFHIDKLDPRVELWITKTTKEESQ